MAVYAHNNALSHIPPRISTGGELVMFKVFNHFLLMLILALHILYNGYMVLSPVESQFSFHYGPSPLQF